MRSLLLHSCVVLAGACTVAGALATAEIRFMHAANPEGEARSAHATLKDAGGATVGRATFEEGANGVLLRLELDGVPPGTRAFHIHEVGRCEAPEFQSAGDHFAPDGDAHGFLSEGGFHLGDLPNLRVAGEGRDVYTFFLERVTLREGERSLLDGDGTALVIHEGQDDYRTDPSGDAGDRIACGVITR